MLTFLYRDFRVFQPVRLVQAVRILVGIYLKYLYRRKGGGFSIEKGKFWAGSDNPIRQAQGMRVALRLEISLNLRFSWPFVAVVSGESYVYLMFKSFMTWFSEVVFAFASLDFASRRVLRHS